ncbi:MAG: DUF1858 domain-containing protein [Candidatus Aquicultor sp.]|nr:DUF1858 domain-containing protein [Candidatus Aquicultor sp.]
MRFSKDMLIEDALTAHPKALDIFLKYDMVCVGCLASSVESLENGANMHNVSIEDLVSELNGLVVDEG